MVNVSIGSCDLAINADNALRMRNKPALGTDEVIFADFEELCDFLEEVLSKIGMIVEDD